jgi:DNA-binding MarR family transcriptional regulator
MNDNSGTSVLNSIRRIVQALRISSRQAEAQLGLSSAQLFVLQKLATAGRPVSMSEIAAMTLTHISSVSVVVSRLVENGLVNKQPSVQDGRRSEVQVTAKGLAFLQSQPQTAQEVLIAALEGMPEDACSNLAGLLEKLVDEAGFSTTAGSMFFEDGGKTLHEFEHPR